MQPTGRPELEATPQGDDDEKNAIHCPQAAPPEPEDLQNMWLEDGVKPAQVGLIASITIQRTSD
jgi:hypothetical protein